MSLPTIAKADFDDPFYDFRGFNPTRESYGQPEPEEYFDPFTGNFTLIYNDISIPGNNGLDLHIKRVYNSNIYRDWDAPQIEPVPQSWVGIGWSLHMGRLVNPGESGCYLEMPDGSKHHFYIDVNDPEQWISKDYWILRMVNGDYEVLFTNGICWTFDWDDVGYFWEPQGDVIYLPTRSIVDLSGNTIFVEYDVMPNAETAIDYIQDACGRIIDFEWQDLGNARYQLVWINVNSNYYYFNYESANYAGYSRLIAVKYPEDPSGYYTNRYEYRDEWPYDEMTRRYNPWGGYYDYTYDWRTFNIGGEFYQFRVLFQRINNGNATWTIDYNVSPGSSNDSTIIYTPCHKVIYWMYGYNNEPPQGENWKLGLILQKKITIGDACENYIMWQYTYDDPALISNDWYYGPVTYDMGVYAPRLTQTKVTERSVSDWNWAFVVSYYTYYQNFEYYHPTRIVETSGATDEDSIETRDSKVTALTYWYQTDKNILNRIATKDVSYSDATGPHHIENYTYYSSAPYTGKVSSAAINGITKNYTYHTNGNLLQITDEMGRYIRNDAYEWGIPCIISNGIYNTSRDINWAGTIHYEDDGNGHRTYYDYDAQNRLIEINPPEGNSTTIIYNPVTNSKKTSRGGGDEWKYYDNNGYLMRWENSLGSKKDFEYSVLGVLLFESFPYNASHQHDAWITYSYDYLLRIKSKGHAGIPPEKWHYYNPGNPFVQYYDRNSWSTNNKIGYDYIAYGDPFNDLRLKRCMYYYSGSYSSEVRYNYNNAGQITEIQHGNGPPYHTYTYTYDPLRIELLTDVEVPEYSTISYTYEENGNIKTVADAAVSKIYTYDAANRAISIDYQGTGISIDYTYDNANNLKHISTSDIERGYGFDAMNRVTRDTLKIDGHEFIMQYRYDGNGNCDQITYPDGAVVSYIYYPENLVKQITDYIVSDIQYHPSNSIESYQLANGLTTTMTYDSEDRLESIYVPNVLHKVYEYDPENNPISITDNINPNFNQSFSYDHFYRLTEFTAPNMWGNGVYSYDDDNVFGRRIQENINGAITNYHYDDDTKRLEYTDGYVNTSFLYDDNGNMIAMKGDHSKFINYDYDNLPTSILNIATGKEVEFEYDGLGKRVKRIQPYEEPAGDSKNSDDYKSITYYYMISPWGEVMYEWLSDMDCSNKYIYLYNHHLVKVISNELGEDVVYFYHNDYQGTPMVITDGSQREIYNWIGYPFGKTYSISEGTDNTHRFIGKEWDKFNDLYYFGGRYYAPDFGTFLTPDPITRGSNNLPIHDPFRMKCYDYCRNNPLKYVDPNGQAYIDRNTGLVITADKSAQLWKNAINASLRGEDVVQPIYWDGNVDGPPSSENYYKDGTWWGRIRSRETITVYKKQSKTKYPIFAANLVNRNDPKEFIEHSISDGWNELYASPYVLGQTKSGEDVIRLVFASYNRKKNTGENLVYLTNTLDNLNEYVKDSGMILYWNSTERQYMFKERN